jgi:hypothetical protein
MSFAQERVRELQEDLDSLFQSLSSSFVNESVSQLLRRSNVSTETLAFSAFDINDIERAEVLIKAIDSIQLDRGSIPKMDSVLNHLNMVEKSLHENWKTTMSGENEELEKVISHLEWLFLAKVTISIYGKMLENLLISTLPLSDDIYYWGELEGNRLWSWIHLFQSDYDIYLFIFLKKKLLNKYSSLIPRGIPL